MSRSLAAPTQTIVTLDLEGVLIPEVWIAVADRTGIDGLTRTTRDEPDYDALMRFRLGLLSENDIGLHDLQKVVAELSPLPGAKDFLDDLRARTQVVILSDTFEQFATPFMRQLDWPTILCHRLVVEGGRLTGYELRQDDQKRKAVDAFRGLNYRVIAGGDSYNDTTMLGAADVGLLFRAPHNVVAEFPQFETFTEFGSLLERITAEL